MPISEEKMKLLTQHTYGTWRAQKGWKKPVYIKDAEGVYLFDDTGKRYLDFSSQLMCSNIGHKNKVIIDAIVKQAQIMPYIGPVFATGPMESAVDALLTVMPSGVDKFFFSTSGAEANEGALIITRQYKSPAYKIISRYHSYHGGTAAAMTLTGDPRRWFGERARYSIDGVCFAPDAYCYRCPFGGKWPECHDCCAEYVDYMLQEVGNVAAVIVEPVVGTNGRIVPSPTYLPKLRQICDAHNVLLIVDEVMSGWWRTGAPFAVDNWDVIPDILTTAKGCTCAYTPVGITATTQKIGAFFEEQPFMHGHTYAFHPLCLSAVSPAVSELKKLVATGLPERVALYLEKQLYALADRHICVGDTRGMGHFWALEIVKNRQTRERFNIKADKFVKPLMTDKMLGEALKAGLFLQDWYDTLIIAPPLIITEKQVDEGIEILDKVLTIADTECVKTDTPPERTAEEFNKIVRDNWKKKRAKE
jgi:taurine--2-oxoglutarate transaminase